MERFKSHDFESNRERIKELLKNQDILSDFDIEGSVFDTVISVLADVTEKNAITANTFFAEQNIRTASIRRNLSAHARNLGYLPYSSHAAKALINVLVELTDFDDIGQLTIPKGSVMSSSDLPFSVTKTIFAERGVDNLFSFENIELQQGIYTAVENIFQKNTPVRIDFDDIDSSFIEVYVQEDLESPSYTQWSFSSNRITVDFNDRVFFLSEYDDGKYQIEFGDGVIGRSPKPGAIVKIVLFRTAGEDGNDISEFQFTLTPESNSPLRTNRASISITTTERSSGGTANESNESIRNNAPRFSSIQNRAITLKDYASIIRNRFPYIKSTAVWSGAESGSSRYEQPGRIYISLNRNDSEFLTETQKADIIDSIKNNFGVFAITPVIVDSSVTKIDVEIKLFLESRIDFQNTQIIDEVNQFVRDFSDNEISSFDGEFRMSRFSSGIDRISESISSNLVNITLSKDYSPRLQDINNFNVNFHNPVTSAISNEFTIYPSFRRAFLRSDVEMIKLISIDNEGKETIINNNAGKIDLETGLIQITDLRVQKYNDRTKTIRFSAIPKSQNILPLRNNILQIGKVQTLLKVKQ